MKKYVSFFRLRLKTGLQYRTAALAGIVTQFFFGFMQIMMFHAFYESDPAAYPMTLGQTAAYVWLQQAFLALFGGWFFEGEIFDTIQNGNLAYELCRPIRIYDMWFARSVALRLSKAMLRCMPILLVAVFLPEGYGICAPISPAAFLLFLYTMIMGLLVMVALSMLYYGTALFTISADGLRILFCALVEFLAGWVIPLPFFPERVRKILEWNPLAAAGNVPFRIYSGNLAGEEMIRAIALQAFWLAVMVAAGRMLCRRGERRAVVQGG